MQKTRRFYGWFVVAGCTLSFGAAVGLYSNCVGVFVSAVPPDMGYSKGAFSVYASIVMLTSYLAMPVLGGLYGRYPADIRKFMAAGGVVITVCGVGYSLATRLWHFYALSVLFGCFGMTLGPLTLTTLINNWFLDKKGLATGIAFAGSGLVSSVMMPRLSAVVAAYGWRTGYRLLAVCGAVMAALAVALVRERPAMMGQLPLGAERTETGAGGGSPLPEVRGITRAQAVKAPATYLLIAGFSLLTVCGSATVGHVLGYLTGSGFSQTTAAAILSSVLLVMTVGKISLGVICDRLGAVRSSVLAGCLGVTSMLLLSAAGKAHWLIFVFVPVYGFGSSILTVPYAYLVSENFGTREYAAVFAFCNLFTGIASAMGSPLSGFLFDVFGHYRIVWPLYAALSLCGGALITLAALSAKRHGYKNA